VRDTPATTHLHADIRAAIQATTDPAPAARSGAAAIASSSLDTKAGDAQDIAQLLPTSEADSTLSSAEKAHTYTLQEALHELRKHEATFKDLQEKITAQEEQLRRQHILLQNQRV
jgi:hypothetical protein